jgi:hypothetical protein
MDDFQGERRFKERCFQERRFQAAQDRFKTLLPHLIELDQLTRDFPGLLLARLEGMGEHRTPLHYLCKYLSSPHLIQSFIDMGPDALYKGGEHGGVRPLGFLCSRADVPLETVETLVEKNPEAFASTDEDGCTPLHAACYVGSMQVVSCLATRFPDAAQMKSNSGECTPLHSLCERRNTPATIEVVELLINTFPRAVTMKNIDGETPLYLACCSRASDRVIQHLVERGPKAVEMLTIRGATVLHGAYYAGGVSIASILHGAYYAGGVSIASILLLLNQWHVASLLLASLRAWRDHRIRPMLPYDCAVDNDATQEQIDFIAQATKEATCALIEYSLCALTSMPVAVRDRMRNFVTVLNIPGFDASASGVALTQTISPHLTPNLIHDLVDSDDLQEQLKLDKDLQSLIGGLVRMNKSGRNYVHAESSNTMKGVVVLNSVSNNVDCMFIHLRENVSLLSRS